MSGSYQKREHYNATLLKHEIVFNGEESPTTFIQDCFHVNRENANKKLNTGTFTPEEIWEIGNQLNMDTEVFMKIFFPDMNEIK